ncbi:endoglucanase [Reichenbachiella sp. 5M10]|uniref:M42 family metallopeptidase n=1 Tax=Reichenbachiella sp. 5M10 TaxID=1889772 RepID=UPI000C15919E|nr:M42 family metallopeptidase [Reichenbachiella sp. 5M10]PIB35882.1 endoglucanase [Reichenbachiella sp. 5M10]
MSFNTPLLKNICEIAGAPGFESRIRNLIIEEIKEYVDSYEIDNMGNLIAFKKGTTDKKVMVAAHMDEIGFIVSHIDDNGFVRFQPLGGFDPKTLTAQRVIIHGRQDVIGVMGSKPIHVMSPEERQKVAKMEDYFIDLGMNKEEVEKVIAVGDSITRDRELIEMGDCINCKSIDNRVSVFILIETLKKITAPSADLYAVFSVQEEVGLRGANVAAHSINPDFGIALDTTIAYDLPGAQPHEYVTKLGHGTAIKILDAMTICDQRMVQFLRDTADSQNIPWQNEILVAGGTDTAGIQQRGKNGAIAGAISIPTRHLHQVIEMAHKDDITGSTDLLIAALEKLTSHDWSWK